MKIAPIALAATVALSGTFAHAQTKPGSPEARPAPPLDTTRDTTGMAPNKSGSGTSTSGGRDDNLDQGRDKMPESNMAVKPSPGRPDIPDPTGRHPR
jgi:hypothetical protein